MLTKHIYVIIINLARADVAELADALDLGSSGRPWEFKSLHPHQISTHTLIQSMGTLLCAQHGRNLTGESPECGLIVPST